MSIDSINIKNLLNTANFLNERVNIGENNLNSADVNSAISSNNLTVEQNQVLLQDIKDAIETKNREYLEREQDIKNYGVPKTTTLQDWSLGVLYSGIALFSFLFLIYIFTNAQNAFFIGMGYLILIFIFFVSIVFVIQRYG